MEGRKVIQIMPVVVPGMDNATTASVGMIALCEDGTIWETSLGGYSGMWRQMPGPEHSYASLTSGYTIREGLKKLLTEDKYDKVSKLLRSGGASL